MLIVMVLSFAVLMVAGLWTAFALGIAGSIVLFMAKGELGLHTLGSILYNSANSYILVAVPLFLLMGEIILRSGAAKHFYRGVAALLPRVSLLQTNIIACAIFSAIAGSSVATAATVGTVAIPEMIKRGYNPRAVYGSLAAGGTLGVLIPPSIIMVLYGALVNVSISGLFMAGLLPKLLMAGLFMVYIAVMVARKPSLAPKDADHISSSALDALHVLPLVLIIAAVLGGIYTGLTTATEAAAIGVAGALIVAAAYGHLKVEVLSESILAAIKLTSMVITIVMGAQILSAAVVYSGLGREVAGWLVDLGLSHWTFFLGLIILYIILGCFVDGISMVYMTLPVLMPSIKQYGFDLTWMGIVLAILIELGQIHPPVGVNLITIHAIAKGKFSDVVIGSFPYVFIMLFMLLLLAIWPGLSLLRTSVLF